MKNGFDRIRERTTNQTKQKVKGQMKNLIVENIFDEAYKLYMPQVRYEIEELTQFLVDQKGDEDWNILEIGTKFGGTFFIWNSINPNGMNISIDFSDGGIHGGISEEQMDKRDLWFYERFENCHFIRWDSHSILTPKYLLDIIFPNWIEKMTSKLESVQLIDFLFIDGDHSYEGVKKDWEMYSPFVKKGGIIAFHDIVISDRHHERNVYVGEFWRDLTSNRKDNICTIDGKEYEIHEFIGSKDQDWAGIAALIKK